MEGEGRSTRSRKREKVEGENVSYRIPHGGRLGLFPLLIKTGKTAQGVLGGVEADTSIYFAVLVIKIKGW